MDITSFSNEPKPTNQLNEGTLVEQARQLREDYDATVIQLRDLMSTMKYAYAMSSMECNGLPAESQNIRTEATILEIRCTGIRKQIEDLFEA